MKFRSNPIKKKKFKWNFANPIDQFIISLMAGVTYYTFSPLYTVHDGERAILFDRFRGVLNGSAGEGTHFLIPFLQKPIWFDVRTRPQYFSTVTGTKDLQVVKLSLCVLSHLDANHLPQNFSTLGYGYSEQVFRSICQEVLKAVVAQFNADQLLTERSRVSDLVRESLTQRAKDFNMVLDHVAITHLSYSAEFSEAVKQNQLALREAERSKFMVAKADQESRAAIIRAEGESESAKLISDATAAAGTALIKLRKVEAAKDNAVTMTKNANVMYVGKNMLFGFLVDRGQ